MFNLKINQCLDYSVFLYNCLKVLLTFREKKYINIILLRNNPFLAMSFNKLYYHWCRDEDMQSLASLMSMKQADIGNLDDFEEDNEDDDENRVNQEEKAAKITGWLVLFALN